MTRRRGSNPPESERRGAHAVADGSVEVRRSASESWNDPSLRASRSRKNDRWQPIRSAASSFADAVLGVWNSENKEVIKHFGEVFELPTDPTLAGMAASVLRSIAQITTYAQADRLCRNALVSVHPLETRSVVRYWSLFARHAFEARTADSFDPELRRALEHIVHTEEATSPISGSADGHRGFLVGWFLANLGPLKPYLVQGSFSTPAAAIEQGRERTAVIGRLTNQKRAAEALARDAVWVGELADLLPLGEGGSVKDAAARLESRRAPGWQGAEEILKKRRNVPESPLYSPKRRREKKPVKSKSARINRAVKRSEAPSIQGATAADHFGRRAQKKNA